MHRLGHGKSKLTVLITVLQEIGELGDAGSRECIPLGPMQHASDDACMHTFVQERHGWGSGDNIGYRRLELLDQPRFVRCERAKLMKSAFALSIRHSNVHLSTLTSLMSLMSIQLLVEVVRSWNSWGARER